jgi:hypothetical protein
LTQNKDFRTVLAIRYPGKMAVAVQNSKSLSELLLKGGQRLAALQATSQARSQVLDQVRAALPPKLAVAVASAGIEEGRLTIGVVGAVWASRLRYCSDILRKRVGKSAGVTIVAVRIRVVPPPPGRPDPAPGL